MLEYVITVRECLYNNKLLMEQQNVFVNKYDSMLSHCILALIK